MNPRQEFLTTLFADLDANGVRYCVMRNYAELYAAQDTDVDLLVSPYSRECFEQCLRAAAARTGFRFVHAARYTNYSQVYWHPQSGFTRIDFEEDSRWRLFPVLEARTVLDDRIRCEEFYIPAPWHESVILFVAVMWRGFLSDRYRKQLGRLYDACPDKTKLCETLADAFGKIGTALADFQAQVATREFDHAWCRRLRRSLILNNHRRGRRWLGLIRNTGTDIHRLWSRLRQPAGISLLFVSASEREQNFEDLIGRIEFLFPAQKNILKTFDLTGSSTAVVRWGWGLQWQRLRALFKGGLFVRAYRLARDTEMLPFVRAHARYLYPSRSFVCLEDSCNQRFLAHVSSGFMAAHSPTVGAENPDFSRSFIEFIAAILGRNPEPRPGRPPRGTFCVLVGLDGAGKTTLARNLCQLAVREQRFQGARYFHWQPRLFRQVQFPLPEFQNLPRKKELPRNAINTLLSAARLAKNVMLANLTYWLRLRPLLRRGYLVLVDRYFYNYHLDPVSVKYYGPAWLLALAGRLFPAPEVVITLSAPPDVLLQRKQELTETEIRRQAATLAGMKFAAPVLAADARRPGCRVGANGDAGNAGTDRMTAPTNCSWRELFAPGETGSGANPLAFRVVRRGGHPFLFLPLSARAAMTALALYPAQSFKARMARAGLGIALRAGVAPGAENLTVTISAADAFLRFLAKTAGMADGVGPKFAVLAGNPHAPGRRFVFLLFDDRDEPVAVVKAGGAAAARKLITHEADFLTEYTAKFAGLPPVRARFSAERVEAFATDFVVGTPPPAGSGPALAGLLEAWIDDGRTVALSDLPAWQRLVAAGEANPLPPEIQALGELRVRPVLLHGDLTPWNIKASGGRWTVMDWERGEHAGIPGWDWFHFVIQPALLVERATPETIAARLEALLAAEDFARYAGATGIRGHERLLVRAYVEYCQRVTRQTEGVDRLRALARVLGARWQ